MISTDVVIVGGGCIGLTLALALANHDIKVTVIDGGPKEQLLTDSPELRVSALSHASEALFTRLDVWDDIIKIRVCPYQSMYVWEKDSFANIHFDSEQLSYSQLGYIVENKVIRNSLLNKLEKVGDTVNLVFEQKVKQINIGDREVLLALEDGTPIIGQLLVGADGANSFVRQHLDMPITFWDYEHEAIIATVKTELDHQFCASQCFLPDGPLAFLPLAGTHISAENPQNFSSIVWSTCSERAKLLLSCAQKQFDQYLTTAFDGRLGLCELQSKRVSFPLKMRYARQWTSSRVTLIGDAAHTIHPLAGLGMNLGLLDAASLAQVLIEAKNDREDLGLHQVLRAFERQGKARAQTYIAAMEGLKRLFTGDNPVLKFIRGSGLSMANSISPIKHQIIKQAMGLTGELPELSKPLKRD